jgi:predicted GNAT superfamily acetyltransferase
MIRDAGLSDLPAVLRLNSEWERVTSPLDEVALVRLHEQAAFHRVFDIDSRVAAFLLALGPGATYESPNYRWFDDRSDRFLYIDRVIVSADFHRNGLGGELYADLMAYARSQGVHRLVCEVDVEPLNVASDAFHARLGFEQVGTQLVADGSKRVSLRELVLAG